MIPPSPFVDALMQVASALVAILDSKRQIIYINDSFIKAAQAQSAEDLIGLRLGNAMKCVHTEEGRKDCGTTKHCQTCGASLAIMGTIQGDRSEQKLCALQGKRDGVSVDLFFRVQTHPMTYNGEKYILLMLQDAAREQQLAALEKVFYKDMRDNLSTLNVASDLLSEAPKDIHEIVAMLQEFSERFSREMEIYWELCLGHKTNLKATLEPLSPKEILSSVASHFKTHSTAKGKHILVKTDVENVTVRSDRLLLSKVIEHMLSNALEASSPGNAVKLWHTIEPAHVGLHVWNPQTIPAPVQLRIFQRNYSPTQQIGRGLGTYWIKLIGETVLGGQVSFESTEEKGTTFSLRLGTVSPKLDSMACTKS